MCSKSVRSHELLPLWGSAHHISIRVYAVILREHMAAAFAMMSETAACLEETLLGTLGTSAAQQPQRKASQSKGMYLQSHELGCRFLVPLKVRVGICM